jgi:hypothetical protein
MSGNSGSSNRRQLYWILLIVAVLVGMGLEARRVQYQLFYRPIVVTREPWQALDPGRPVDPLKFEVVQEGSGAIVEPGDLIQISLWWWSAAENTFKQRNEDWWIWVGFRTRKETPFYALYHPRLVSAFIGQREGSGVKFTESPDPHPLSMTLYINPFGDADLAWMGSLVKKSMNISIPAVGPEYDVVYIKKFFKGHLKYRTTHLYDDTWYFRNYDLRSSQLINTPRERWYDDALYEGMSADGQRATFQYGPVNAGGPIDRGGGGERLGVWSRNEWKTLPAGVQVESGQMDLSETSK